MPERPGDFKVLLRPLARPAPAAVRLRQLLKLALRTFGFRAVEVIEVPPEGPREPPEAAENRHGPGEPCQTPTSP